MTRDTLLAFVVVLGFASPSYGAADRTPASLAGPAISKRTWQDDKGQTHAPLADHGQPATVLLFLMHDCPITNSVAPELNRLTTEFGKRGVRFYRIYCTETAGDLQKHSRDFGLTSPALLDPGLELARHTGATRAPEAVIVGSTGEILYRGRIDDRAVKIGVVRPVANHHDLRVAIQAVLEGNIPEPRFTSAVGCYLPTIAPSAKPELQIPSNPKLP